MEEKRTSIFENGLIWFGAGVSIAEILTGTYLAPLGFKRGLAAIVLGHIIGCVMLFLAGVIGGKARRSAMETVKMSFGQKGSLLFSVLNVLQLVGWTAIMIYDGALAANGVVRTGRWVWCLVIGILIILWIMIGITNLGKVNAFAMTALFILTLILCKVIFFDSGAIGMAADDSMTFGAAVELSVAMPLSWLPLIGDYTREAREPVKATAASAIVYGLVSCWMYVIGMGAAIYTGEYDIAQIMLKAGLGIAGLLIIVFSTVTTTFLDAYSAGISSESIIARWNGKHVAVIDGDRYDCGYRVSDGQYHGLPVFDRLCVRADDRHPDRGLLPFEKGQQQRSGQYPQPAGMDCGICYIQDSDAHRYAGRQYTSGYGNHHSSVPDRKQDSEAEKIVPNEK